MATRIPLESIFLNMSRNPEGGYRNDSLDGRASQIRDLEAPIKVKKLTLIEMVGLPTMKTDIFEARDIDALKRKILERLATATTSEHTAALTIRVACVPDRMSMPSFIVRNEVEMESVIEKLRMLMEAERSIKNIILRDFDVVGRPEDKIAVRLNTATGTIEMYKGAKSTSILNNVETDDPNFVSLSSKGGMLKPTVDLVGRNVPISEVKRVVEIIKMNEDRIAELEEMAIQAGISEKHNPQGVVLEFSYNGGLVNFTDFD